MRVLALVLTCLSCCGSAHEQQTLRNHRQLQDAEVFASLLLALNPALAFTSSSPAVGKLTHKALRPATRNANMHMKVPSLGRRSLLQNSLAALALSFPLASQAASIKFDENTGTRQDESAVSAYEGMNLQRGFEELDTRVKALDGEAKTTVDYYAKILMKLKEGEYDLASGEKLGAAYNSIVKLSGDDKRMKKEADKIKKLMPKVEEAAKSRLAGKTTYYALQLGEAVEQWSYGYKPIA